MQPQENATKKIKTKIELGIARYVFEELTHKFYV